MTRILCACAAVIAVMALHQHPAQAREESPWCMIVSMGEDAVYWDCQYRSFEDCRPHLFEGNRGFCNENPRYHGPEQPARPRSSRRQRE